MNIFPTKDDKQVLIPTESNKYPFLIKTNTFDNRGINEYWLVKADGTLSGDAFTDDEKDKYPEFLSNI